MNSSELKRGDHVRLKSGGAVMRIVHVGDDAGTPTAWCLWHDGTKQTTGKFPVDSLMKVKAPKPRLRFVQLIPPGAAG
ncbi:MAG: YodC family protein [Planctomycetia bacterium]|nr:YodC family protein [Planctomycetia bacterium]